MIYDSRGIMIAGKRKDEMEKIQKMFKKAKEHGDDKVAIAIQTYEMVDKHIRRLDSDLVRTSFGKFSSFQQTLWNLHTLKSY